MENKPNKKDLFLPEGTWADIVSKIDEKLRIMHSIEGFGQISVQFSVKNGVILDIIFSDEIRVRGIGSKESIDNKKVT